MKLKTFIPLVLTAFFSLNVDAGAYKSSYLTFEATTNTTFKSRNADRRIYPASVTKLLTAHIILRDIDDLQVKTIISKNAWGYRFRHSSRMFLEPNMKITLSDLLKGLLVQSGNDAAVALAEAHSGTVEAFVDEMNRTARSLGMKNSHFMNPNGRHHRNHYTTANDQKKLILEIFKTTPNLTSYTTLEHFTFNDIDQLNRNRTLQNEESIGLKTGFTPQSGYNLAGCYSVNNGIFCTLEFGASSSDKRFKNSEDSFNSFKQNFEVFHIRPLDETVSVDHSRYRITSKASHHILGSPNDTMKRAIKLDKHPNGQSMTTSVEFTIGKTKTITVPATLTNIREDRNRPRNKH